MFTGCFTILATQVTCEEISQCYHDVNICLWTDGSELSQSAAQTACQQRNGFFLPRITNDSIQSKLAEFRNASDNLLLGRGFWIDVRAVGINNWHWIDDSPLAGLFVFTPVCCMRRQGGDVWDGIFLRHRTEIRDGAAISLKKVSFKFLYSCFFGYFRCF